jgi:hypothetical protein
MARAGEVKDGGAENMLEGCEAKMRMRASVAGRS